MKTMHREDQDVRDGAYLLWQHDVVDGAVASCDVDARGARVLDLSR
jgi:hypothetical protein